MNKIKAVGVYVTDIKKEVLIALRRILRVAEVDSRQVAKVTGLSTSQLLVLRFIQREGGPTVGRVAEELMLRQATVTAIVDRLESRGLVQRQRRETDRRMVEVHLAEPGALLLDECPPLLQHRFLARLEELEAWEQTWLLAALQRVASMLDAEHLDASPILQAGAGPSPDSASAEALEPAPRAGPAEETARGRGGEAASRSRA